MKSKGAELESRNNLGSHNPSPSSFKNKKLPCGNKKLKITKKLSGTEKFPEFYHKLKEEVGEEILKCDKSFGIFNYAKKIQKLFKKKVREKKEFVLKFNGRDEIYRQNDFKYNAVKIDSMMWGDKLGEALTNIKSDLKLKDNRWDVQRK